MASKKSDDQPIIREQPMTYDDYAALDDDNRYELVDGVLELMSPAPTVSHQVLSFQLQRRIADTCGNDYLILYSRLLHDGRDHGLIKGSSDLIERLDQMNRSKVLLVDGMALLFRAFYATSYSGYIRKTKAGLPTNAVYGFIQYFFDAINTFKPTHVVCCWDMGSTTFRTEQFAGYKANRGEPPLELIPQFDLVKEVVEEMGILNVGVVGYEADDCLGTLAKRLGAHSDVFILTGDHDMLQLVDDNVTVVIMKKGKLNYAIYDPEFLWAERQLTPAQIIDLKGFMGDTSDNYPGVKGIGEKTAVKLLIDYGSVDGVLENLVQLPKGIKSKIEASLDMLHLSRDLATIRLDAPVSCELSQCPWGLRRESALRKFEELEFGGLFKLLESHFIPEPDPFAV